MMEVLPQNCRWLITNDFNMVENKPHKSRICKRFMNDTEREQWEELKDYYNLCVLDKVFVRYYTLLVSIHL